MPAVVLIIVPIAIGGAAVGISAVGVYLVRLFKRKKKGEVLLKEPNASYPLRLIDREQIARIAWRFRFALPSPKETLGCAVGQHVYLSTHFDGVPLRRPYTPTTLPSERGYVDFLIKIYPQSERYPRGGRMTSFLNQMQIGDFVDVRGPEGLLTYEAPGEFVTRASPNSAERTIKVTRIGMIAGGSGVTPMLQLIRAVLSDPKDATKLYLVCANRREADIMGRADLEELMGHHPNQFHVWHTLDRPEHDWAYSRGAVDACLLREHLPPPNAATLVLLCGPTGMVEEACKPALDQLGFAEEQCYVF